MTVPFEQIFEFFQKTAPEIFGAGVKFAVRKSSGTALADQQIAVFIKLTASEEFPVISFTFFHRKSPVDDQRGAAGSCQQIGGGYSGWTGADDNGIP